MKREVKTSSYTLTVPLCRRWRPTCQNVCSCCKILMGTDVALRYWQTRAHAQTLSLSLIHIPARSLRLTPPTLSPPSVLHLFCLSAFFCSIFPAFFPRSVAWPAPSVSALVFSVWQCLAPGRKLTQTKA